MQRQPPLLEIQDSLFWRYSITSMCVWIPGLFLHGRCISCRHALAHKALLANVHLVHSQLRKPALHEGSKEP